MIKKYNYLFPHSIRARFLGHLIFLKAFITFDPISLRPLFPLLAIARPILLYRWTMSEATTPASETATSNSTGPVFDNPTTLKWGTPKHDSLLPAGWKKLPPVVADRQDISQEAWQNSSLDWNRTKFYRSQVSSMGRGLHDYVMALEFHAIGYRQESDVFLPIARDIWDTTRQRYSKMQDATVIYEIKIKISTTKQGNLSVTEYYNLMNRFWLELDHYQDIKMRYSKDAKALVNLVERDRIFNFLQDWMWNLIHSIYKFLGRIGCLHWMKFSPLFMLKKVDGLFC